MLIVDALLVEFFDGLNLRLLGLSALNEDHGESDKSSLSNEVSLIVREWRQQFEGLIEAGSRAPNTDSHCSAVAEMRVVRLGEMSNHFRNGLWLLEEEEAKVHQRCSLNVVTHIEHSKAEKLLDSRGVLGACVGTANCKHTTITHSGVFTTNHRLDKGVCSILLTIH